MDAINIVDLRDHVDELVERLDAGESVDLVRDGKRVATVKPAVSPPLLNEPFDWEELRRLRESLPFDPTSAGDLVRQMRDESRY